MLKSCSVISAMIAGIGLVSSVGAHADSSNMTKEVITHAPVAVMADHIHSEGEWMLSYRYMSMQMEGLRRGAEPTSQSEALLEYMAVPDEMQMGMHMFGAMYAPSDELTLMLMANYWDNEMDSVMKMGEMRSSFSTQSNGWGDTKFSALVKGWYSGHWASHYQVGVSLPTGSINERDVTPMSDDALLGYPMQTGTGSYQAILGYTISYQAENWVSGSQVNWQVPINDNSEDYRVGNQLRLTQWLSYALNQTIGLSARLQYSYRGNYDGGDSRLNSMMAPIADSNMRGGEQYLYALGANFYFPELGGHRIAVEYEKPFKQSFDGLQLDTESVVTVGWQYAF